MTRFSDEPRGTAARKMPASATRVKPRPAHVDVALSSLIVPVLALVGVAVAGCVTGG